MYSYKKLILAVIALCAVINTTIYSGCSPDNFHDNTRQRDFEAVQQFVNSRRTLSYKEKEKQLRVFGDVRADYFYRRETQNDVNVRGSGTPFPHATFESEVNLKFDYKCDKSYAFVHLNLDNDWGVEDSEFLCDRDPGGLQGSGFCDYICLK